MGMGNAPVLILREGTKRDKGKDAQFNNITAARTIADAVRSSLGVAGDRQRGPFGDASPPQKSGEGVFK